MKTRTSIKAVFIVTGLLATALMARVFFVLMFDYYKDGTNTVIYGVLEDAARADRSGDMRAMGLVLHRDWHAFPQEFRRHFEQSPAQLNTLHKRASDRPWLISPEILYYVLRTENQAGHAVYVGKAVDWQATGVQLGRFEVQIYYRALWLSILFAAIFTALLLFVIKALVQPLESLKAWAQALSGTVSSATVKPQHFRFHEFAEIAEILQRSVDAKRPVCAWSRSFSNLPATSCARRWR
ncbi:hypothetical protein [Ferrimonas pelagia]|uniref:HAMP domain-containing protein n=1 Tax=Ferrimonas pelagia TaxID=1177826 RepID=A0ABP9FDG8_9GAMM